MTLIDLRPGLQAHLATDTAIAAIVGSGNDARIYPVKAPQGETRPHIIYHKISGQGDHHMQGPSGLNRPRMQIDCWAKRSDVASQLALAVKARLDGLKEPIPYGSNSPQDEVEVIGAFFDSEREDYDKETELYLTSHDYLIWFRES